MEQYELSIDISNHGDMNHTFINICVCVCVQIYNRSTYVYVIGEIGSENDQNVFVALKEKKEEDETCQFGMKLTWRKQSKYSTRIFPLEWRHSTNNIEIFSKLLVHFRLQSYLCSTTNILFDLICYLDISRFPC